MKIIVNAQVPDGDIADLDVDEDGIKQEVRDVMENLAESAGVGLVSLEVTIEKENA